MWLQLIIPSSGLGLQVRSFSRRAWVWIGSFWNEKGSRECDGMMSVFECILAIKVVRDALNWPSAATFS